MNQLTFLFLYFMALPFATAQKGNAQKSMAPLDTLFYEAMNQQWKIALQDDCKSDWTKRWFKDGETSRIENSNLGMAFYAGSFNKTVTKVDNADHTVLWTKQSFSGDIKIEYDYTRLDTIKRFVSILYFFAEGSGNAPYVKDIYQWRDLRRVPAMKEYFNHMNTYHISYSAFDNNGADEDYIRARSYMPDKSGLDGTDLKNEYFNTGFFQTGVMHHIIVISRGNHIFMSVASPGKSSIFFWCKDTHPLHESGRVGFRLMSCRGALFDNVKIYTLNK